MYEYCCAHPCQRPQCMDPNGALEHTRMSPSRFTWCGEYRSTVKVSTCNTPPRTFISSPVVLDAVAAAEEDHDLLVQVLLQKREQQQQPLVSRGHHVALLQTLTRRHGTAVVDADVQRLVLEAQASQVLNLQSMKAT